MNTPASNTGLRVGEWSVDSAAGELSGVPGAVRVEPKVMDLLLLLASQPGQVVTRERIMNALWPGLVVGEDSLARTVSKLRQALGDDARSPRYVETISKRGYRLLAEVTMSAAATPTTAPTVAPVSAARNHKKWLGVAALGIAGLIGLGWLLGRGPAPPVSSDDSALLVSRADDYYFQFSRADNEAAIELYQRVLALHPDHAPALAGLANALTQRAIRWPESPGTGPAEFTRLGDALANGHLDREPARTQLRRARQLAERAVGVAPDSAATHKALGFVAGAQRRFEAALVSYRRAVALDPDAWGPLINIGDVLEISGRDDEALAYFEQAYAAMGRAYDRNPVQVRPWYAPMGVLIASRYRARGNLLAAEAWYRRVLTQSPLQPEATGGLAEVLRTGGDIAAADRLCDELMQRVGATAACTRKARESAR
ncbi:winged helix-turn-helix domain-containing protein [Pseudoxanthomonas sacheonensis]|uniref:DNA-binding winged helix-turn-helix (WHTH) protein/Tfp pilus assembly protein PilF n=1 Tax=Pseudoxanthomonas sacheonensis TaxID=443615 RepID=A0ABU1RRS2_9GAMM|nr:winged helix-turn-helix domain-containing protein [Pseudoxanthomonas sacheonensis]MDR6841477.1 DNA-binding winged helix-turn-helix (wHTH) protein/Tfp pilus assembly protein PilF [Pseudoxanthomonas sacheonensis]